MENKCHAFFVSLFIQKKIALNCLCLDYEENINKNKNTTKKNRINNKKKPKSTAQIIGHFFLNI